MNLSPAWRARLPVLVVLGVLLAANAAVLVGYRLYYEERFHGLRKEEEALRARRDEARAAVERARATQERVSSVQKAVDGFFSETIGTREARLASVLEEVYSLTRKVGLRPSTIGYAIAPEPGIDVLRMTFQVDGRYADIKRLLGGFEASPQFFVVETVGVSLDPAQPDILHVSFVVGRFFRDPSALPHPARTARRARELRTPAPGRPR